MGVLATDDFNRADANPIGGNWTTVTSEGAFKIVSNAVQPASLSADSTAYYNAVTWPADQYAQVKVTVSETTAGNGLGPCVRASASANTFYRLVADHAGSGNIELSKFIAGAYTQLWSRTATFVDGDTLRLEVQGTTLRAYVNGAQIGADATDSAIATGNAGLAYSSNTVSVSGDDWEGGDFTAAAVPYTPPRYVLLGGPGQTPWMQRERRDANTVATAANPLASPLDSAWQAGARYWHLYNDIASRGWRPQQRTYVSDPNLLAPTGTDPLGMPTGPAVDTAAYWQRRWTPQQPQRESDPNLLNSALLENELLGGADSARHAQAAAFTDRREVPQQRSYVSDPILLDAAQLENELLGGFDDLRRRAQLAATHVDRREVPQQPPRWTVYFDAGPDSPPLTLSWGAGGRYWALYNQAGWQPDRREVPQQRPYVSDPSFYPTVAPTDPLTVAWGTGGIYWLLYNTAALQVSRRLVAQQRERESDPALLASAELENELLGGADDRQRHAAWFVDRRLVPQQPHWSDPALLGPPAADPLALAAGVGGDLWRRANTPAYADRREAPQQPARATLYFDAGPGTPPLTLSWGAGGNLWHLYNRAADLVDRTWRPQQRMYLSDPVFYFVAPPVNATSTALVVGLVTSLAAATGNASTSTVTGKATSFPTVSDG